MRNPALDALSPLIGRWTVELANAEFLEEGQTMEGTATVEWLDDAFVVMRSEMPGGPPRSTSVIGRNESRETYEMLYYDERGVSRIYEMTFDGRSWSLSRADPDFHQRFVAELTDADTIRARWEKSDGSGPWEHDFDLTYTRMA